MLRIGIGPSYFKKDDGSFDYAEGGKRMLEHGYECLDFDWYANTENELYSGENEEEFIENTKRWRDRLLSSGIKVHQVHGPWCGAYRDVSEESRAERFEKMSKCLKAASILGAKYMAIHPLMPYGENSGENPEEQYAINKKFYTALAQVAEECGVIICLENMPFTEPPLSSVPALLGLVKDINHPNVRMCLDTGHANIFPLSIGDCVRLIGKEYLMILHCHDNMGKADQHLHPYAGTADWEDFSNALVEIGFEGVVNLECSVRPNSYTTFEERVQKELELAAKAKRIAKQI